MTQTAMKEVIKKDLDTKIFGVLYLKMRRLRSYGYIISDNKAEGDAKLDVWTGFNCIREKDGTKHHKKIRCIAGKWEIK